MVAGIGGLYQLTQLNADFHILADSGFCDVDGILKTTEKFLTQIEEEYLQGSGSVRAATFVACRQAAEWGMKVLGSYRRLTVGFDRKSPRHRKRLIDVACLLNNFKVSNGQGNQISIVYSGCDNFVFDTDSDTDDECYTTFLQVNNYFEDDEVECDENI